MKNSTDTTTWTDEQHAYYKLLTERMAQDRATAPSRIVLDKAPPGGWTDADKVRRS